MTRLSAGDLAPSFERRPVFGTAVRIPPAAGRSVLLIFARHLGSPVTVEFIRRLQDVVEELQLASIDPVLVTRSPLARARDAVPRRHLLFRMLVDPDGELFDTFGVGDVGLAPSLVGLPGLLRLLAEHGQGVVEGSLLQGCAAFLVASGGRLRWTWYASGAFEITDPRCVLEL